MKRNSKLLAALAISTTLISSGCASNQRLIDASVARGVAQAQPILPQLPADCRKREPHAPLIAGAEVRLVLKDERKALDRANDRVIRCANFYDDAKSKAESPDDS